MFSLTLSRNIPAGKFLKSKRCLAELREHIFSMSTESRFVKWVMFLERNCIVKWAIFFPKFCWLWDLVLENLKLKRNSEDAHCYIWANIKKWYARNNISKRRIPNMTFWIIYILVQISLLGTALGRFSQWFFF